MCRRTGGGPESKRGERDWPHAIFSQFWLMYCLSAAKSRRFFFDLCFCFAPYSILDNQGSSFPIERSSSSSSSLGRIAASATIKAERGERLKTKGKRKRPLRKAGRGGDWKFLFPPYGPPLPRSQKKRPAGILSPAALQAELEMSTLSIFRRDRKISFRLVLPDFSVLLITIILFLRNSAQRVRYLDASIFGPSWHPMRLDRPDSGDAS